MITDQICRFDKEYLKSQKECKTKDLDNSMIIFTYKSIFKEIFEVETTHSRNFKVYTLLPNFTYISIFKEIFEVETTLLRNFKVYTLLPNFL